MGAAYEETARRRAGAPRQQRDIVLCSRAMNAPDPKYLVILSGVTFAGVAAWAGWALMKFKEPWAVAGDAPLEEADDAKPSKAAKPAEKAAATAKAPDDAEDDESDDDEDEEQAEGDEADDAKTAKKS